MTTLLTLVSKQVWPQILAVVHLRPHRVILLHSAEQSESAIPARRLKKFFDQTGLVPKGGTQTVEIAHDDFQTVRNQIEQFWLSQDRPPLCVNFTGGNKLMALAAFQWARERAMKAFYLERGFQLTWFDFDQGRSETRAERINPQPADALDPLRLVRCHADASEVEREGQRICLNSTGRAVSEADFWKRLPSLTAEQAGRWLTVTDTGNREQNQGDALELIVAAALLRLGVQQVRRSLRLKVHSAPGVSARLPHAELDLLFNYGGKLWLVDCKDRKPVTDLANGLRRISQPRTSADRQQFDELFRRIRDQLSISDTKVIKEDLLSARELGGLLGETICVRRAALSDEVREFARRNRVHLIENCRQANTLRDGLRSILHPKAAATPDSLADLKAHFHK
jgi:hypothetical protein